MSKKNLFKYAEKCLYDYVKNTARLDVIKEDLRVMRITGDVHAQQYDGVNSQSGEHSDPVFGHVAKIERKEEQIQKLERITQPITNMVKILKDSAEKGSVQNKELLDILQLRYFDKLPNDVIQDELKLTHSTFYNRRYSLVYMAVSFLGL